METVARKYLTYVINTTRNCFQKDLSEVPEDRLAEANLKNQNGKWYAEKLREYAVVILAEIMEANSCDLKTEYADRLLHQKKAITAINMTKAIITQLYEEHIIKQKKLKAWLGEIKKVKDPLFRWKLSDKKKMGNR